MASHPLLKSRPLISGVRQRTMAGISGPVVVLNFLGEDGTTVGNSVVTPAELSRFGHDILAFAAAARAATPGVSPLRTHSQLMSMPDDAILYRVSAGGERWTVRRPAPKRRRPSGDFIVAAIGGALVFAIVLLLSTQAYPG